MSIDKKECDERVARVRADRAKRLKAKNIEIRKLKRELRDCMKKKPKSKPLYFGASIYELIQQQRDEVYDFLHELKRAGGNATEIFLVHSLAGNTFQPYWYDGNKFDLDAWNGEYWACLNFFFYECQKLGIVPFIRIQDYCSIKRSECNKYYAFMNNKQGFTNVYDRGLYKHYSKLNKRLLKELEDAGIKKYFIVPINECDGSSNEVRIFNTEYLRWWGYNASINIIISTDPRHFKSLKSLGCRYEIHNVANVTELMIVAECYGKDIFPNGDGCHGDGIESWNGYREPSVEQARELGKYIRDNDMFGYCYKMRSVLAKKGKIDMSRADFSVLRALTKTEE